MSRPKGAADLRYQAVMSFEEIGNELGITRQCVEIYYRRAIKKLRKKNKECLMLLELARSKQKPNV